MQKLPKLARIAFVVVVALLVAGAGLLTYRYLIAPTTLTVAAGSLDGEAVRLVNAIATRLAANNARVRLKVVHKDTVVEATRAFAAREVDVAVVRSDVGDLSSARTIVLLTHGVTLVVALPGTSIESIEGLKGKTLGVLANEINGRLVDAIDKAYDLTKGRARIRNLSMTELPKAVQAKQIQALLVVIPLTEKYLAMLRDLAPKGGKQSLRLLAIDSAEAIAAVHNSYESYELPKGSLRGSPPNPDEDLTTVRVPYYVVARKELSNDHAGDLAKAIMEVRRDLLAEFPVLAQIAAPSTDKDAQIPIHPGAATYFGGDEKSLFDKYGDWLFYGTMMLGTLTSLLVGVGKFIGSDTPPPNPVNMIYDLFGRVRDARTETELDEIEEAVDGILRDELAKPASDSSNAAALALAAHRLEHLLDRRRRDIRAQGAMVSEPA
jgi:TRAP transporter TAXI family solute receptor